MLPPPEKSDRRRIWTLAGGKTISALYLARDNTTVTVVIDGQTKFTKIPLTKLSEADLEWLGLKPAPTSGQKNLLGPHFHL